MLNINNIRNFAAVIATSAGLLISCAGLEEQQSQTVGYLAAPSLEVDVTVENPVQTKAWDLDIPQPSVEDIYIVVKDKDGNVKYDGYGFWNSPLVMPVGSYTIDAVVGTNSFGLPYLKGSVSGSIAQLEQNNAEQLTLALENSLVKVTLSEELGAHFTPSATAMLTSGGETYSAGYGEWIYVPSGADLSLELSGTNTADNAATFTYSLNSPSPKVAYSVVCGLDKTDWPSISLKVKSEDAWLSRIYITEPVSFSGSISQENRESVVYEAVPASSDWSNEADIMTAEAEGGVFVFKGLTPGEYKVRARVGVLPSNVVTVNTALDAARDMTVKATHSYTSGELDGTDVSMTLNKSAYIKNSVSQWNMALYNAAGGEALRSGLSVDAVSDGSVITSGWPFLPTGSGEEYILNAGILMDGAEYSISPSVTFTNQPAFTVTASGYTTYDKYCDYLNSKSEADLNAANQEGKAEYIFQISSSAAISENLLKNPNYTTKVYYTCGPYTEVAYDFVNGDGDTDNAVKVHNIGDIGGFSWGQNTLTAGVSFAGTRFNSAGDVCHITGLPYKKDFTSDSSTDGWSFVGRSGYNHSYTQDYRSGCGYLLYYAYTNDKGCDAFSPEYHVPDIINIQSDTKFYAGSTGGNAKTYTLYAGVTSGTTVTKDTETSIKEKGGCLTEGFNSTTLTFTTQFNNHNRLSFSHNADLAWGRPESHYIYIGYLSVMYR